jgi:outer membrane murein-binding lipoprotein Lpp
MAGLETAQRHVTEALQRLEAALVRRLTSAPGDGSHGNVEALNAERDTLARDVAALRGECDRLAAAVREAEEQNESMRNLTQSVARRLDGPIAEIDRMLEG